MRLGGRFFIVDPLDGTREFLAGLDEYTVNIALIENETAGRRRGRGAGARPDLARSCRPRRRAACAVAGRRAGYRARARRHSHPRASRQRRARPDQPLASRCGHRCLCRSADAAGKDRLRLGVEILPAGGRLRRSLSAARRRCRNGTSPPATPCWSPPAATCANPTAARSAMAKATQKAIILVAGLHRHGRWRRFRWCMIF